MFVRLISRVFASNVPCGDASNSPSRLRLIDRVY